MQPIGTLWIKIRKKLLFFLTLKKLYIYPAKKYEFHNLSFSQEGEDRVVHKLFESQKTGFYVDVGALHPQRFSNTYLFYLNGWRGLNIDAKPGSMDQFKKIRSRDINLEKAISNTGTELTYYEFNDPALNTFVEDLRRERASVAGYRVTAVKKLQTYTLAEILDTYLPPNQPVDFMSVDVEGLDLEVLQSNNWEKYKPKVVIVEELNYDKNKGQQEENQITNFLTTRGYQLYGKTGYSLIFRLGEF